MKFILYVQLILFTAISACNKTKAPVFGAMPPTVEDTVIVTPPAKDSTEKYFLALGDSYTIGQSVTIEERFPAQTTSLLRGYGLNMLTPEYIATSGWTTLNLQNAITTQNPTGPYDVVTLLIGVNDQFQSGDTSGYRERFTQLLQKSIELAGNKTAHVFVLSIPDYSVTPFAASYNTAEISEEIDLFNAINKNVTLSHNISYTDITPSTRMASTDVSLIATDGLHPSGKEYAKWAALLAPKIKAVLQ